MIVTPRLSQAAVTPDQKDESSRHIE